MTKSITTAHLPYQIPKNPKDQLLFLAKILDIPISLVEHGGADEVDAMAATMLYRHLGRQLKLNAMTMITNLNNKRLASRLRALAVNTTYVNPQWGIWSLTNNELLADQAAHDKFNELASIAGVSASALGLKDILTEIKRTGRLGPGAWTLLVFYGIVLLNAQELKKANEEISHRRGSLKSSIYY